MQETYDTNEQRESTVSPIPGPAPEKKQESFFAEILRFSLIALVIVIPIRVFIAQPFIVSGASMEPTFSTGEYLIIDQVTYRFEDPARGDVVVFRYPRDTSKFFIKRIIGMPGEIVEISGNVVTIKNAEHPQGFTLEEPYVATMRPDTNLVEKLGEGEYFVMGDNRDASSDSRVWGVLQDTFIVGRALVRLLPLTEANYLPGKYIQPEEAGTLEATP